jgi:hypothetical protein
MRKISPNHLNALYRYFENKKKHDEYLKFFNIGQKKDEKERVASTARYVGLRLPVMGFMKED